METFLKFCGHSSLVVPARFAQQLVFLRAPFSDMRLVAIWSVADNVRGDGANQHSAPLVDWP